MPIYSSDDVKLMQEFKENAFKCVLKEIKASTSWRDKNNLEKNFEEYGFTGHYTYLAKYYEDNPHEMLLALYLLWDEVD